MRQKYEFISSSYRFNDCCIYIRDNFLSTQIKFSVIIRLQYKLSDNQNDRGMTEATQRNLSIKVTQIMEGQKRSCWSGV